VNVVGALDAIGGTPLVRLRRLVPEGAATVLVKVEGGNPTGSYKDRMAKSIIEAAETRGDLAPGQRVVEFSGGSTGSSLAYVCALTDHPVTIVSSDAFAPEKLDTMRALGAEVVIVPSDGGLITADLFVRMRVVLDEIRAAEGAWWVDQFHNEDALVGYGRMGAEILEAAEASGHRIDGFCASVGTGGMLAGVAGTLKRHGTVRVTALEPLTSPMLTQGSSGPHGVEGIATGVRPPLMVEGLWDDALALDEDEARWLARRIAREEGIFAGTSSAMNILGAIRIASAMSASDTVVTVACDTGLKYLTGDLYRSRA
jgi:cysteine synthase A